jgi:hypothetical protein
MLNRNFAAVILPRLSSPYNAGHQLSPRELVTLQGLQPAEAPKS